MVKTSDFESENSGSSPGEAASSAPYKITVTTYISDFGSVTQSGQPPLYRTATQEETMRKMAEAMAAKCDNGLSTEHYLWLIGLGLEAIGVEAEDIWKLSELGYGTCDGYCNSDDW